MRGGYHHHYYAMWYFLKDLVEIAKSLKEKGELDPNNDLFMNEIYDKVADFYCGFFGEENRVSITLFIQKQFETALL